MSVMQRISHTLSPLIPVRGDAPRDYHLWYYNRKVWETTTWLGVPILKSPMDLWNYQEIIFSLKPSLLIEFGSFNGGSALFFASLLRQMGKPFKILTVDVDHSRIPEQVRTDPAIEFLTISSSAPEVGRVIARLRAEFPGPVFAILDSDHNKEHVLAEMMLLRPATM